MGVTPSADVKPAASRCQIFTDANHRRQIISGLKQAAGRLELIRGGDVERQLEDCLLLSLGVRATPVLAYLAYQIFKEQSLADLFGGDSDFEASASYTLKTGGRATLGQISCADVFEDFKLGFDAPVTVAFIDKLEVIVDSKGYGSELLKRFLDQSEIDLFFLHARNDYAKNYFIQHGFVDSGIRSGEDPVMVFCR